MKNKKVIIGIAVLISLLVSSYFYTLPSEWLPHTNKEISSLAVINFQNGKEITVEEKEISDEIIGIITDTKTHKRALFLDEEGYSDADSGYLITVNYSDGSFSELKYSFLKGGLVYAKGNMLCVGKNEKLTVLLSDLTE